MKVRKLLHTRYRLNDLDRSVRFYREVLGLEEVRRHRSPRGSELVFLKAPESEETIELCHFPNSGPVEVQADLTHLAFQVDSLEAFGQHHARIRLGQKEIAGGRVRTSSASAGVRAAPGPSTVQPAARSSASASSCTGSVTITRGIRWESA
jgi:lactoylglutathione lyase